MREDGGRRSRRSQETDITQASRDVSASKPKTLGERLRGLVRPSDEWPIPIDPAVIEHERQRARARENRAADAITAFSGSMLFVYVHIIWFSCWIGFGVEKYPFGLLTMIVSLEAIFLSTFVLISQNRADAKRQVIANEHWTTVKAESEQNAELLRLSKQILALTQEVKEMATSFADQDQLATLTKEVRALKSTHDQRPTTS
jgi:uncharacterized membrane protein